MTAPRRVAIGKEYVILREDAEYRRIADEQAALRQVATLVAQGASPRTVFDAVAVEIERQLETDGVVVARNEPGDGVMIVAAAEAARCACRPARASATTGTATAASLASRTRWACA